MEKGPHRCRCDPFSNVQDQMVLLHRVGDVVGRVRRSVRSVVGSVQRSVHGVVGSVRRIFSRVGGVVGSVFRATRASGQAKRSSQNERKSDRLSHGQKPLSENKIVQTTPGEKLTPHCACAPIRNALRRARQSHSCAGGMIGPAFVRSCGKFALLDAYKDFFIYARHARCNRHFPGIG